jgi:hypothetical protein
VYGGGEWLTLLDFPTRPDPSDAEAALRETWAREGDWIADSCEPNLLGNPIAIFSPDEVPRRRARRRECQRRTTRMQVAALLEAHALEADDGDRARQWRGGALWLGWMAALAADESTIDFRSAAVHAQMRADMRVLAAAARSGDDVVAPFAALLGRYLPERGRLL